MPFNNQGKQAVPLDTFGGLVTLADAVDLPEGASPRNYDVDFTVGSVKTRAGLSSAFEYNGGSETETPSAAATATPQIIPWQNPSNILVPGDYASVILGTAVTSVTWTPEFAEDITGTLTPWTNPQNATSPSSFATNTCDTGNFSNALKLYGGVPTIPSSATILGIVVTFNSSATNVLVTASLNSLADNQLFIPTASASFQSRGSSSYLWGQTLTPANISNLSVWLQGHRTAAGNTLEINNFTVTIYYSFPEDTTSDALNVTEWDFDISDSSQIVSLRVDLTGYSTTSDNEVTAQLILNGHPIGSSQAVNLPVGTPGTVVFNPSGWLTTFTPATLNNTTFGVAFTATSAGEVFLGGTPPQITVNVTEESVNFNYVKTGEYQLGAENNAGDIQTLALDSEGNLWVDSNFSGELSLLDGSITEGSYAKSVSLDDREYLCFSDLVTGTDIPMQYVPNANPGESYLDRVSQVGPGAAPLFNINSNINSSSPIASITSWSITSNVVTFLATNTFTAGEVVQIAGLVTGAFMNGASFPIATASGTQFTVDLVHANASATETGTATPQYTFAISSITQPAQQVVSPDPNTFDCILWSAGPGSTSAGNVLTFYYKDAQQNPTGDTSLINLYNSGVPTYVTITGTPIGSGTFQVTSVSTGKAPGGQDTQFYFTVQAQSSSYEKLGVSSRVPGNYQQTIATITTPVPIPGLAVGSQIVLGNVNVAAWDGTYTIVQALNASNMQITASSCSGGTATFDFTLNGTSPAPIVGQYVTITGTLGGGGALNGPGQLISSVSGSTFTIAGYSIQNFGTTPEQGQATTAGTQFTIDPGPAAAGTTDNPIYGNATSGQLTTIGGTDQVVGAGTRQGTVFFVTRNGFQTAPAYPIEFTTPANSNYIYVSNLPIGPPNTVSRIVAFSEAGALNVEGGSFYYIPNPVVFTVNGVTYTSSATVINDNTTTTAQFTFTDQVLLAATEIDVQGNNLFNEIELANPAWCTAYAGRMFYGGCNSKIQNFNNLSFDGGYLSNPGGATLPLGWSVQADPTTGDPATISGFSITSNVATINAFNTFVAGQQVYIAGLTTGTYFNGLTFTVLETGLSGSQFEVSIDQADVSETTDSGTATPINLGATLKESPIFGNSYYINNGTASTQSVLGMIYQSAFKDQYGVSIINQNTLYSVRVTCRTPSGTQLGSLNIDLTDLNPGVGFGTTYASYSLPCSQMETSFVTFTGSIAFANLPTGFGGQTPVTQNLQLRLWAEGLINGGDIEIDRIEIFPTQTPVDKTTVWASYVDNFEAFDSVTGDMDTSLSNGQAVNGAVELFNQLYLLKTSSILVTSDSDGTEPAQWDINPVSNTVGAIGPNAFDIGEQYIITACRQGVFMFQGKQPGKIMHEIYQIWNALNWSAGNTIWVKNDITNRKLYIGVPLPTGPGTVSFSPNIRGEGGWLPYAAANPNPQYPNVVLMCSYEGIDTAEELAAAPGLHTTMFGTLNDVDMRRKWSIWNISAPYADFITLEDGSTAPIMFGTGQHTSQILRLDPLSTSDAGVAIHSDYCTYGFVDDQKSSQMPLLGDGIKVYQYLKVLVTGSGICNVQTLPNSISNPNNPWTIPGGLNLDKNPGGANWFEKPLNAKGYQVFLEFSTNAIGAYFNLSKIQLFGNMSLMPNRGNLM